MTMLPRPSTALRTVSRSWPTLYLSWSSYSAIACLLAWSLRHQSQRHIHGGLEAGIGCRQVAHDICHGQQLVEAKGDG